MADIDLERKSGGKGWLWALLALLVLALLAWWLWPGGGEDIEYTDTDTVEMTEPAEPAAPTTTTREPITDIAGITLGDILGNPDGHLGDAFPRAEVTAVEVPTDRGFWVEDEGERLFVLINDQPTEQPKDINPGATLRIEGGTFRDRTFLPELSGEPISAATEEIAEEQGIFLVVDESNITILEGGQPQPGTDPAQSVQ